MKQIKLFTDGACSGNPGPGGYAYKLKYNSNEKNGTAGYKLTTNNRMELLAVIEGLRQLKEKCDVSVYTDSKYICDAIEKKWLDSWKKSGWRAKSKKSVKNIDLWLEMDSLLNKHNVRFEWIKGHAGHLENEWCDMAAVAASRGNILLEDKNYLKEVSIDNF